MIIDINLDIDEGFAYVQEKSDYGTEKEKKIDLDEFLQKYTSLVKEKEDNYSFLYLPPGTVEYRKNLNTVTYFVQTYPYKKFYGLEDSNDDYLVVIKTNLTATEIISSKCYKTKGAFNKHFSSFVCVYEDDIVYPVSDEFDAIKKCLGKAVNSENKSLVKKLKYKEIV